MAETKSIDKQINKPELEDILDAHKTDVKFAINKVQIGEIVSFDSAAQSASIKLLLKRVVSVDPNGVQTLQQRPELVKCPVMVLFGGTSFINFPIVPGDSCIVLFNDREIDNWYNKGGVQTPTSRRMHDISDGIALVGIRPLSNSIANYLANGIRLSHGGGSSQMDFTDAMISSIAALFLHTGDMHITGNLTIEGETYGDSGSNWKVAANIVQTSGNSIHAGNGANGTFNIVQVVDGIVVSGS